MCDTRLPCSGGCTLSSPVRNNCIQPPVCRQRACPWICVSLWSSDAVSRESPAHVASRPHFGPQPSSLWKDAVGCRRLFRIPILIAVWRLLIGLSLLLSLPECPLWLCFGAPSSSSVLGQLSSSCFHDVFHLGVFQVPVDIPAPCPWEPLDGCVVALHWLPVRLAGCSRQLPVYILCCTLSRATLSETSRVTPWGLSVIGNALLTPHFPLNTIQI